MIRFSKLNNAKFLSHLDTKRIFERTIRRIGLNLVYKEGFNPQPKITFASPLSLGFTSEAEYLLVQIEQNTTAQNLVLRNVVKESPNFSLLDKIKISLNENLPDGFKIIYVKGLKEKIKLTTLVDALSYKVLIGSPKNANKRTFVHPDNLSHALEKFLSKKTLTILKKNKKGEENKIKVRDSLIDFDVRNANATDLFVFERTSEAYKSQYLKDVEFPFSHLLITLKNNTLNPKIIIDTFIKESKLNLEYEIFRSNMYKIKGKKLIRLDKLDEILFG